MKRNRRPERRDSSRQALKSVSSAWLAARMMPAPGGRARSTSRSRGSRGSRLRQARSNLRKVWTAQMTHPQGLAGRKLGPSDMGPLRTSVGLSPPRQVAHAFRPDHARPDAAMSTMRAIDVPRCQVFPAGPAPDLLSGRTTTAHQGQKHLPATPPKGSGRSSAMPGSTPTSGDMASKDATVPMSLGARVATLVAILGPLVGLAVAVALFWGGGFTWVDLGLLVGMYLLTALGITVGYHRLFVHRSFETNIVVKFVLAVLGSMAVQGSLLKWAALHRRHHQHSDKMDDPHTPHHQGRGILGWLRGYWRAHIGWFFEPEPAELSRYVPDLERSRALCVASVLFPLWITLGLHPGRSRRTAIRD